MSSISPNIKRSRLRRARRVAMHLCTAIAVGLFVMMVVSFWRGDEWNNHECTPEIGVESFAGGLTLNWSRTYGLRSLPTSESPSVNIRSNGRLLTQYGVDLRHFSYDTNGQFYWRRVVSFGFDSYDDIEGNHFGAESWTTSYSLRFPHWLPILLFAAPGVIAFIKRRPRVPAGHCTVCGYDLRASPEQCPECGTANASATLAEP